MFPPHSAPAEVLSTPLACKVRKGKHAGRRHTILRGRPDHFPHLNHDFRLTASSYSTFPGEASLAGNERCRRGHRSPHFSVLHCSMILDVESLLGAGSCWVVCTLSSLLYVLIVAFQYYTIVGINTAVVRVLFFSGTNPCNYPQVIRT